jgi:catechol 2,3-dioxygenase-like lactoylglutathione lyase family enzyme
MHGLIGVMRIYAKHAAILLATGLLFQFVTLHSGAQDKPKRPRITGIDHIRLYVTDVDKSREFYHKLLGLPSVAGDCGGTARSCFGWVQLGWGQRVELEEAPKQAPNDWVAEIGFATNDLDQMQRYLSAHDVSVSPVTKDRNGARHFELRDPEGNAIAFVQRLLPIIEPPIKPPPSPPLGNRLLHAGFVVRDMNAENRFYVDVLGFRLYWQGGMKDEGVDWYELQVPDGDNWIEYMLNIPATADHKALGAQNHFSFGVPEIQAAAEQLRKNGAQKIAGPGIGRDGKRGLNVYDPDDTRVEVTEFTPAREPCCHPYTAAHPTP